MPAVELVKKTQLSSFRKLAMGTWRTAADPSVYGSLEVECDAVMDYIAAFRVATGQHLTLTHLMAKVMGHVYAEMPDANAMLRWGGIWMRKEISVFFQVAMEDPDTGQIDLSGVTVRSPETKTMAEIADEFDRAAKRVRAGNDEEKEAARQSFKKMPGFLVGWVLSLMSFLIYGLNLDLRWAGLPKDPFGSVMITNIGSLGLDEAYVPLVPYSRVPLLVAVGAVRRTLVPDDAGDPKVVQIVKLCATFDHRILDGAHAAAMSKVVRRCFADPVGAFGPIPRGAVGA